MWQMSMWQLVMTRIQCISLNVMHQVDGYIIIQGLMERLMEYTIKNDRAKFLGDYHPCSKKHEASTTNVFYDGFVDYNWNGKQDSGEGVIVWRGPRNNNGHATTNLDMNTWETAKS